MKDPLQTEASPYEVLNVTRQAGAKEVEKALLKSMQRRVPWNQAKAASDALLRDPVGRAKVDLLEYDDEVLRRLDPNPLETGGALAIESREATAEKWEQQLAERFPDLQLVHTLGIHWYWLARQLEQQNPGGNNGTDARLSHAWRRVIGYWGMLAATQSVWQGAYGLAESQSASLKRWLMENLENRLNNLHIRCAGGSSAQSEFRFLELCLKTELRAAKTMAETGIGTEHGRVCCGPLLLKQFGWLDTFREQVAEQCRKNPGRFESLLSALSEYSSIAILLDNQKPEAALEAIQALSDKEQGTSEVQRLKAQAYDLLAQQLVEMKKVEEALDNWERALSCRPGVAEAATMRKKLITAAQERANALQARQPDRAIAILEKAVALTDDPSLKVLLAGMLAGLGDSTIGKIQRQLKDQGTKITREMLGECVIAFGRLERAAKLGSKRAAEILQVGRQVLEEVQARFKLSDEALAEARPNLPEKAARLWEQANRSAAIKSWNGAVDKLRDAVSAAGGSDDQTVREALASALAMRGVDTLMRVVNELQERQQKIMAFRANLQAGSFMGVCSVKSCRLPARSAWTAPDGQFPLCAMHALELQRTLGGDDVKSKLQSGATDLVEAQEWDPQSAYIQTQLKQVRELMTQAGLPMPVPRTRNTSRKFRKSSEAHNANIPAESNGQPPVLPALRWSHNTRVAASIAAVVCVLVVLIAIFSGHKPAVLLSPSVIAHPPHAKRSQPRPAPVSASPTAAAPSIQPQQAAKETSNNRKQPLLSLVGQSRQSKLSSDSDRKQPPLSSVAQPGLASAEPSRPAVNYPLSITLSEAPVAYKLGRQLLDGTDKQRDPVPALEQLRGAADAGLAAAQNDVAVLYDKGEGGSVDLPQAVVYFQRSAEQKFPAALVNLASLYEEGRGVTNDLAAAWRLWKGAAELGQPDAQYWLGRTYLQGNSVITQNVREACRWLAKAAAQGHDRSSEAWKDLQNSLQRESPPGPVLDRLVLKSGETVHGYLLKETATEIVLQVPHYNSTIFTTRTVAQAEVKSFEREALDHKNAREAYARLRSWQLRPDQEWPVATCDQGVQLLEDFIAAYPQSEYTAPALQRLAQWKVERDQVAAGQVKNGNRWMSPNEKDQIKKRAEQVVLIRQRDQLQRDMDELQQRIESTREELSRADSRAEGQSYSQPSDRGVRRLGDAAREYQARTAAGQSSQLRQRLTMYEQQKIGGSQQLEALNSKIGADFNNFDTQPDTFPTAKSSLPVTRESNFAPLLRDRVRLGGSQMIEPSSQATGRTRYGNRQEKNEQPDRLIPSDSQVCLRLLNGNKIEGTLVGVTADTADVKIPNGVITVHLGDLSPESKLLILRSAFGENYAKQVLAAEKRNARGSTP